MEDKLFKQTLAITGPSGAGKTTLSNYLRQKYNYPFVVHTTTRKPRADDEEGFYRYISKEEFEEKIDNGEFLFYSSYKERYYGILNSDFYDTYNNSNGVIINVNYMDLEQLALLKDKLNMVIIQLTFRDIKEMILARTQNRNQTPEDTLLRIEVALRNEKLYEEQIKKYIDITCFTDELDFNSEVDYVVKKMGAIYDNKRN